jgi:uroporphyrinogen-III synthase
MNDKYCILSTASLNGRLTGLAAEQGIGLDVIPFIDIIHDSTSDTADRVRVLAATAATVIFTSANAAHAVADVIAGSSPSWQVYCLEGATKAVLKKYFIPEHIAGTAPDAAGLAASVCAAGPQEVFFFCGDKRMDTLPEALEAHGIKVNELVVYRTVATPVTISRQYDGILFFSPSAVASFFSVNNINAGTVLFAVGHTTAGAIQQAVPNKIVVSPNPSREQVVHEAITYFQQQSNN